MGKTLSHLFTLALFVMLAFVNAMPAAQAVDLPVANNSALSGIGFDDKPLYLPVQRNFQMAMLTAGSELGRTCGKMEAYGWRMNQSEQSRVDQIFNSTVDRLRGLGYVVEMQSPASVSRDITMFTADRPNRHLLTMWSAGEIGLVLVMCETSAPPAAHNARGTQAWPSVQVFPQDVAKLDSPSRKNPDKTGTPFSPIGSWVGSYVCGQGYTGATLQISQMRGNNFEGVFHFYPTAKNPSVPEGRYMVYGQYDADSARILINPGQWLQRPTNFYNTIMVGSFDTMENSLSAYFQGVNGCTSFEAHYDKNVPITSVSSHDKHPKKKMKAKVKAKKVVKPKALSSSSLVIPQVVAPAAALPPAPAPVAAVPAPAPVLAAPAPAPAPEAPHAAAFIPPAVAPAPAPAVAVPAPAAVTQEKPPLVVGEPTSGAPSTK